MVAICNSVRLNQPIPPILSQLAGLQSLDIRDCGLFGPIPGAITQMNQLARLRLDENVLTGSIPSALGQFTSFAVLELGNNWLTGAVPDFPNARSADVLLTGNFLTSIPPDWTVFDRDISYNCYPQPLPASCSETGFADNLCTPNRQDCPATVLLSKVSGDGQRTQAGTVFANPLVVSVTDFSHNPLSNMPVTFSGSGDQQCHREHGSERAGYRVHHRKRHYRRQHCRCLHRSQYDRRLRPYCRFGSQLLNQYRRHQHCRLRCWDTAGSPRRHLSWRHCQLKPDRRPNDSTLANGHLLQLRRTALYRRAVSPFKATASPSAAAAIRASSSSRVAMSRCRTSHLKTAWAKAAAHNMAAPERAWAERFFRTAARSRCKVSTC